MIKVTVLYGHPTSPDEFEAYYANVHRPLYNKIQGVARTEVTKFFPGPDGVMPQYYRMAESYFDTESQLQETLMSPEGQALMTDLTKLATGGYVLMIGSLEE